MTRRTIHLRLVLDADEAARPSHDDESLTAEDDLCYEVNKAIVVYEEDHPTRLVITSEWSTEIEHPAIILEASDLRVGYVVPTGRFELGVITDVRPGVLPELIAIDTEEPSGHVATRYLHPDDEIHVMRHRE